MPTQQSPPPGPVAVQPQWYPPSGVTTVEQLLSQLQKAQRNLHHRDRTTHQLQQQLTKLERRFQATCTETHRHPHPCFSGICRVDRQPCTLPACSRAALRPHRTTFSRIQRDLRSEQSTGGARLSSAGAWSRECCSELRWNDAGAIGGRSGEEGSHTHWWMGPADKSWGGLGACCCRGRSAPG